MIAVLQIFFVLGLIVVIILLVFKPRRHHEVQPLPENLAGLLGDYVEFYRDLTDDRKTSFVARVEHFLSTVRITGVNAIVEDIDMVLIGAAAIIPVFSFTDWQYVNLHEVLVYPGNFNEEFEQSGNERGVTGMVGTGALQHVMIVSKWQLRQGFISPADHRNTAIHEFVHLIDKMDGTMDGVPEIILERRFVGEWKNVVDECITAIRNGTSDIDLYAATSPVEFFAVASEYFFKHPAMMQERHVALHEMLARIYRAGKYG